MAAIAFKKTNENTQEVLNVKQSAVESLVKRGLMQFSFTPF